MRPADLKTQIFLDSGDPSETREIRDLLGFLDGQTTNPSLISKNLGALDKKFFTREINDFYKNIIKELDKIIPGSSLSIEVYVDHNTAVDEMVRQARDMFTWSDNAYIKLPITHHGLAAAKILVAEGIRLNMTLCFSVSQAAAVYSATAFAHTDGVYISPFVGRLDDQAVNGISLVKNIKKLYAHGDGHVSILAASIRNLDHFLASLALGADIITAPAKVLRAWAEIGFILPDHNYKYKTDLASIEFTDLNLQADWQSFNIQHDLTDAGLQSFADDWNNLIKN